MNIEHCKIEISRGKSNKNKTQIYILKIISYQLKLKKNAHLISKYKSLRGTVLKMRRGQLVLVLL